MKQKKAEQTHSLPVSSYRTFETYMSKAVPLQSGRNQSMEAGRWRSARPYVESYLQSGIERACPPIPCQPKGRRCASSTAAKAQDFAVTLPHRERQDIERSRQEAARDYGFSKRTTRIF